MTKAKKNTNSTGLAGEFAVLSALNLRGWNASLTLGNAKGVDILAYRDDDVNPIKIEVKTSSDSEKFGISSIFGRNISWRMDKKHENISRKNLFYCFVRWSVSVKNAIRFDENIFPIFYIVPSEVVAKYVREEHMLWIKKKGKGAGFVSKMRNFRIGDGVSKYKIETPSVEKHKNAWNLLMTNKKEK